MHLFALVLALVVSPSHGFDYQFGTWNVHVSRLSRDASGSPKWVTYDGTHTVTPLWHGRANIGVLEIRGAAGSIEGTQLRLFDPATNRWKLSFANSTDGALQSPSVGSFHDGVGDFRSIEVVDGKHVIVRTLSTIHSSTSYTDVIARSYDGAKTWSPVWIATYDKQVPALPDGARDFDWDFGSWHTHIRRLLRPLSGAKAWVTYDGTVTVRKALGGYANVEEVEANGPNHLEILGVRLYDEASHQWSLYGANSKEGTLETPATVGEFVRGRGVFYDQETFDGRTILDRQTFFNITPASYSFEQAFSDDGGRTWEPNFVAKLTRTSRTAPSEGSQTVADASHDFDFSYGTWSTHITTYDTNGEGAGSPTAYAGTVAVRKIWGGRAFMEEIKASNASGGFEGLTLFLYNPQSRQWSQTFAGKGSGAFDASMVGAFKDGRGELVSFPATDGGTLVLAREVWSDIGRNTHHFEIQYSRDGGKTWHRSFVADKTRIGPGL